MSGARADERRGSRGVAGGYVAAGSRVAAGGRGCGGCAMQGSARQGAVTTDRAVDAAIMATVDSFDIDARVTKLA